MATAADPPPPPPPAAACPLPFPPRFHVALAFVDAPPSGPLDLSDDADLALRALALQALEGPCTVPRPPGPGWLAGSGPDAAAAAAAVQRWQAWKELGDLAAVEAMRLYVRVLDEEVPGWWGAAQAAGLAERVADGGGAWPPPPSKPRPLSGSSVSVDIDARPLRPPPDGHWEAVSPAAPHPAPPPRYLHGAALLHPACASLLVAGGCAPGGRLLGDTWRLDLESLVWAAAGPRTGAPGALPPRSGSVLLPWGAGGALAVGGAAPRAEREAGRAPVRMDVHSYDPAAERWSALPTTGPAPPAGGGHVAVRLGRRVVVWGGETRDAGPPSPGGASPRPRPSPRSPPSSSVSVLDVPSLTWSRVPCGGSPPPPRSGAAGVAVAGRWVVLVGGAADDGDDGDGGGLSSDVAVLDTAGGPGGDAFTWLAPPVAGPSPPPRAGHAAALLGSSVFIVGGGDGAAGRADAWALDVSGLPSGPLTWAPAAPPAALPSARAAASEGAALVALPAARALLAMGGNAGRLHADLAVLRLPAAAVGPAPPAPVHAPEPAGGAGAGPAPAAAHPPPPPADRAELALMRRQLASAQAALAEVVAREEAALAREEAALADAAAQRAGRLAAEAEARRWKAAAGAAGVVDAPPAAVEEEEGEGEAGRGGEGRGGDQPARKGVWAFISGA